MGFRCCILERPWLDVPSRYNSCRCALTSTKLRRTRPNNAACRTSPIKLPSICSSPAMCSSSTCSGRRWTAPLSGDRKSTHLNSSHRCTSYVDFCLIKIQHICPFTSLVPLKGEEHGEECAPP